MKYTYDSLLNEVEVLTNMLNKSNCENEKKLLEIEIKHTKEKISKFLIKG